MYNSLREQPVISALVSPAEKLWPKYRMLSQAKWTTRAKVLRSSDIFHTCTNKLGLSSVNFANFLDPFRTELRSELPHLFRHLPVSFASLCETLISFPGLGPQRKMWFLSWAMLDCSQSTIVSWGRWDIARVVNDQNNGHLDFQMSRGGRRRRL